MSNLSNIFRMIKKSENESETQIIYAFKYSYKML